jgi:hypothetical protein
MPSGKGQPQQFLPARIMPEAAARFLIGKASAHLLPL